MDIVVLACEGNSEVELMFQLMKDDQLIFDTNSILDGRPIHLRQPKLISPIINTLPPDANITFYRIGDTQKDEFDISCFGESRGNHIKINKLCTTPEIEILIIINEKMYDNYLKVKTKIRPKQFVKSYVENFVSFKEYVQTHNMLFAIKEYKRIKKHKSGEGFLADIIKD